MSVSAHSAGTDTATLYVMVIGWKGFGVHPSPSPARGGTTRTGDLKCMEVNTGFFRKRLMQTKSSGDSHWLEIWSNHFCLSMGPNGGAVAMDSGLIFPSWMGCCQKSAVTTLCVLWAPFTLRISFQNGGKTCLLPFFATEQMTNHAEKFSQTESNSVRQVKTHTYCVMNREEYFLYQQIFLHSTVINITLSLKWDLILYFIWSGDTFNE